MATITPTNLRPPIKHHSNLYLSVLVPETLLSALVNNASIARGARTIAYDTGTDDAAGYTVISNAVTAGTSDDIGTSLMLEVDTTTGTEIVRVKSITGNQTSGTITVAENGINWSDGLSIRIKHFFQIAPVPPAIRSGVFYKDYDIAFATDFATQPNPVTIIGPPLAGFLSAGSIAFSLNSSSSYAIAQGATISSRVWACVHNGGATTDIAFSSTIAANPTLTITAAGTYWLSCQVTDSNSKTQITYRAIFVYDSSNLPYQDFTVQALGGNWDSGQWRCSVTLTGDLTLADVPDGSLAVIWYQNYFDGVEGYVNVWSPFGNNIVYCGYMWSDSDQDDFSAGTGQAAFEIISPVMYLDAITDYGTVSLEAQTSPALWSDYASWLSIGRAIHHLLKWDTTILEVCDVLGLTDNTYGVKVCEFTEDTLLQRINGLANDRGIHARLVSSRLGRLHLVQDSQMLDGAARAALDTVFSITTNDISGGVNVTRQNTDTRAFADLDGFGYSHPTSTAIIAMIPGYQEGGTSYNLPEFRGTGIELKKSQVLDSAGAQTDANERVGRLLALANVSPREIRFACRGNYLGAFDIVPSAGWYQWNLTDATLKRALPLNTILTACRSVTHTPVYENNIFTGFIQTTEVVLQPEAEGPDGIPGNYPTSYPTITTYQPTWDESGASGDPLDGFLLAWSDLPGGALEAAVGSIGSISLGTAVIVYGSNTNYVSVAALSTTQVIICYYDGSNGVAKILDISGTTITVTPVAANPGTTFNSGATSWISVAALSSTKAIVTCRHNATGAGRAYILDVSGSTITPGSAAAFSDNSALYTSVCRLTATRAIVSFRDNVDADGKASILNVSGSTITPTAAANWSGVEEPEYTSICSLDSATAIIAYRRVTNPLKGVALTSIDASTFSTGTLTNLDATDNGFDNVPGMWFISTINTTRAIVGYQTDNLPFVIKAIAVEHSAGTLTPGSIITISPSTGYDESPAICYAGGNRAIIAYGQSAQARIASISISGTTLTDNNDDVIFRSGALTVGGNSICRLRDIV